ncbi:MAG: metallophosphoesterase [Elusimicrobia bacterium]|nr:metallophosphoesterase [Elusimicrobiota bacterium]
MLAMFGFIAVVILIYLGMQYYVAFWLLRSFPSLPLSPQAARITVLILALSFPFSMYCLRHFRGAWTAAFAYLSFIWLGWVLIWLASAACGDLVLLAARLREASEAWRPWVSGAVLIAVAAGGVWSLYDAGRMPRLREVEVRLPNLPGELDGSTVVQLSDLHLGVTVPLGKFARIVSQVSALDPDLVVLTGDILDAGLNDEAGFAAIGSGLRARLGVFAVLGNHEFYHGIETSAKAFRSMGARLLRNEVVELPGGLQVAAVDDIRTAGISASELASLLAKLDPAKPSLLLSHQPLLFDAAARAGAGLMLSGHTHQGQIFPFGFIVRLFYPRFHGLYRNGASSLYVTSGTGQWGPPMRLFTRAEIVRFTLRRERQPEGTNPNRLHKSKARTRAATAE